MQGMARNKCSSLSSERRVRGRGTGRYAVVVLQAVAAAIVVVVAVVVGTLATVQLGTDHSTLLKLID